MFREKQLTMSYRLAKMCALRSYQSIYDKNKEIKTGSLVKLIFLVDDKDTNAERLWVQITEIPLSTSNILFFVKVISSPYFKS